ncbi:30S ribosomal protein S6e [Candidatus Woesearchaeota archaeon]|nr:30S ribosomal protein S6e [Candidatus Woesearchaeota archaeon]
MEFKIVISDPKSGKSAQREVKDQNAKFFSGKKIGDTFKGEAIDMQGYEFEITGGSDYCGFPMRKGIPGPVRKKILTGKGVGFTIKGKKHHRYKKGLRKRRTVCGDTIHAKIVQINLKATKIGKDNIFEEKKEEAAPKAPAEGEAKQEEVKQETKTEETKETE